MCTYAFTIVPVLYLRRFNGLPIDDAFHAEAELPVPGAVAADAWNRQTLAKT